MNSGKVAPALKGPDKISRMTETPSQPRRDHAGKKGDGAQREQQPTAFAIGDRDTFSRREWESQCLWGKLKESNKKLREVALRQESPRTAPLKLGLYANKK